MHEFAVRIRPHVDCELAAADRAESEGRLDESFRHLERAHVLAQRSTREHVRVHGRMFAWARRRHDRREALGQVIRLVGAATKTALGLVPEGNTGGANVSPFRRIEIPPDLRAILSSVSK